jgi:hypothetical protein
MKTIYENERFLLVFDKLILVDAKKHLIFNHLTQVEGYFFWQLMLNYAETTFKKKTVRCTKSS